MEIAQALSISPQTVKHHISRILGKLHVPNRTLAAVERSGAVWSKSSAPARLFGRMLRRPRRMEPGSRGGSRTIRPWGPTDLREADAVDPADTDSPGFLPPPSRIHTPEAGVHAL